jgi:hypothetical protein
MNVCYLRELFNQLRELMPEVFSRCASTLEDSSLDDPRHWTPSGSFSKSGSFAIFAAIRRASSLVSILAAERRFAFIIDVAQRLTVSVRHDETVGRDFGARRGKRRQQARQSWAARGLTR